MTDLLIQIFSSDVTVLAAMTVGVLIVVACAALIVLLACTLVEELAEHVMQRRANRDADREFCERARVEW